MYHLDKPLGGYTSIPERQNSPVWISTSWSIHTGPPDKRGTLFEPHNGTVITNADIRVDAADDGRIDDYSNIVLDDSLDKSITKQRSGDITRSSAVVHRAPTEKIKAHEIRIVVVALTGRGAAHVHIYGGDAFATNLKF
jgi:hypothetical protein